MSLFEKYTTCQKNYKDDCLLLNKAVKAIHPLIHTKMYFLFKGYLPFKGTFLTS